MKKYILPLLFLLLLSSCENEQLSDVTGYGNIRLSIKTEQEISVETRAAVEATAEQLANYTLTVKQGSTILLSKKYSAIDLDKELSFPREENYTVAAENCTETEAESANNNWGQARIAGISDPFTIYIGQTTDVTLACTMQNAKVSVTFDTEKLTEAQITDYALTIYEPSKERTCKFNETTANKYAYFNIDSDPQLTYRLTGKHGNTDIDVQTATLNIAAGQYYKLNVTVAPTGTLELTVTIDNSVTDQPATNKPVNPYN